MSLIVQQLDQADVMLTNALNEPTIRQRLAAVGYSEAKIQLGISTVANARAQAKSHQVSYTSKKLASRQVQTELVSLRQLLVEHRAVARMAFRHQPEMHVTLQLDTKISRKQSVWLDQAADFYESLLTQAKVMQRYDVTKDELEQARGQLQSIKNLRLNNLQKKGKAQHATQQRDVALKELSQWLSRFKAAARLALADEPQLLEVLGIVVTA
ncbi:MAG: hypothetical protein RIG62_14100 [Cyclobacteriaceae bacterium]